MVPARLPLFPRKVDDASFALRRPRRGRTHISRRLRLGCLLAGALLAFPADGAAKPLPVPFRGEYQAELWSIEEGFPENSCSGIVFSPQGYLWLSTFRGLVRFNGQEFRPWAPAAMPFLKSTGIISMFQDRTQRTWFSTVDGLVTNAGETWKRWGDAEGWGDPADFVRSFAEDAGGNVVLTRFSGRVLRLEGGQFRELPMPAGSGGALAAFDRDGTLYVVRNGFAGFFADGAWQPLEPGPAAELRAVGAGQDREGNALIVCRDELLRVQRGRVVSRLPLSENVTAFWRLAEDVTGAVWLASIESGAYRIQPDGRVKHFLKADGLPHSGPTRVVFADESGSVWIGSGVGGFTRLRPARFRYLGDPEGVGDQEILAVAPLRDGRLLLASHSSGLQAFESGNPVVPVVPRQEAFPFFYSVLRQRDDTVWLGAFGKGLMTLEGSRPVPQVTDVFGENESVTTLFEDSRGRLWAGGDRHVAVRENGRFRAVVFPAPTVVRRPTFFAERRDGTVLLTQHHEIFSYGPDGVGREPLVRLPEDWQISTVFVDRDDRVWIGTSKHGLSVFQSGQLSRIPAERGLPSPTVSSLTQDNQGRLWFSCGRKIIRADPSELCASSDGPVAAPVFRVFDRDDGLRELDVPFGTQPTVAKDDLGRLWFCLVRGVAMVDPATIKLNDQPPKVVIESISFVSDGSRNPAEIPVNEQPITPRLPAGSRLIRINYAALDFLAPHKQRFRVRLDDDPDEWQDMDRETVVSFLELPAGRHTLQVQASGSDGVWNYTGAVQAFELAPFFWQTGWFRGLVLLGLVGLTGGSAWFVANQRTRVARDKIERERHLAEAQARLALVLENTSDFVAFFDASHTLVYLNRAGRTLIGLPSTVDIKTMRTAAILPAWAQDEFARLALPAALRDGTWSGDSALLNSDGREIPVSQVILAHRSPGGTLDFISMIARDISAAKRLSIVQDALRRLATSLTAALEPRSLGATVAAACRTLFAHDAFFLVLINARGDVELGAYMEDTHDGDPGPHAVPPSIDSLSPRMRPVIDGSPLLVNRADEEGNTNVQAFKVWGHVQRRSQSLMFAPVLWEGRVFGIISVQSYSPRRYQHTDLQQLQTLADHCGAAIARMNAEASLRKNEERLRLAMQTAQMGSWEIDVATRALLASPEAEDVYGYARGTLSGQVEILAAQVVEPGASELRELLEGLLRGQTSEIDHTHRLALPDGRERWLELKGHRQQGADAAGAVRIIGVTADITSRRHAELERARLEEQLRQSQKLEAIGTLAGGIAHDFNNILTSILGNAELALIDTPKTEPTREFIDKIKKSGQRARDLVRRILAFSRPHETRRQPTPVQPVVDEVVKLLRATIPAGVEIAVTVGPDLPMVEVDSTELHQVLLNLGTNAWHALEGRPGRIRFALAAQSVGATRMPADLSPGNYVKIAVSDTGKGIPAEVMPRIFDPFFTTKAPGEGTGLGLSVVHGIVRANGGGIDVSSTVGAGTTFDLYFPAAQRTAPPPETVHRRTVAPLPNTAKGEHILFVDDEEALVMVAERVFGRAGYRITTCLRPKQALAIFRADPAAIHLVISDLAMPEMSGLDLTAELLRLKPDLPIILTSGYLRPGEAETALQQGVREVVEKPNTPHELLPIVERLLKTRTKTTASAADSQA